MGVIFLSFGILLGLIVLLLPIAWSALLLLSLTALFVVLVLSGAVQWSSLRAKLYLLVLNRRDPNVPEFEYSGKREENDTLVVAFAGGAMLMGGIPMLEFGKTLQMLNVDYALVSDWRHSWYMHPVCEAELQVRLAPLLPRYKRVVLIGNCLGATGALLFASYAHKVLAFAPLTSLKHAAGWYWINSLRFPKQLRESLEKRIEESVSKCKGRVCVYYGKKDASFAKYLPKSDKLTIQMGAATPSELKKKGLLVNFLKQHLEGQDEFVQAPEQVETLL